jgi:hypothetical protein
MFEDELKTKLPLKSWDTLSQFNDGLVTVHTFNVIFRTSRHPFYLHQFNSFERNIVLWAALLHDICKQGYPLFEGKDHIHPFTSAARTLEIFNEFKLFSLNSDC